MKKHVAGSFALAAAALLLPLAPLHAEAAPKPLKVFILLGKAMAEAMQDLIGTGTQ